MTTVDKPPAWKTFPADRFGVSPVPWAVIAVWGQRAPCLELCAGVSPASANLPSAT